MGWRPAIITVATTVPPYALILLNREHAMAACYYHSSDYSTALCAYSPQQALRSRMTSTGHTGPQGLYEYQSYTWAYEYLLVLYRTVGRAPA